MTKAVALAVLAIITLTALAFVYGWANPLYIGTGGALLLGAAVAAFILSLKSDRRNKREWGRQYQRALAHGTARKYSRQGGDLYDNGRFREAITEYEQAIQLDPQVYQAIYQRGESFRRLADFPSAILDLERVPQDFPLYNEAQMRRSWAQKGLSSHMSDIDRALGGTRGLPPKPATQTGRQSLVQPTTTLAAVETFEKSAGGRRRQVEQLADGSRRQVDEEWWCRERRTYTQIRG